MLEEMLAQSSLVAAFGGDISPLVPEGTAGKILSALSGRQA